PADGRSLAYRGRVGDKTGLVVSRPDGSGARFLAEMTGTNAPLPGSGATIAWSPDGKRIAFVSSVAGPETANAPGDPNVITRYLYKPDAAEGLTHFNDNRRLHLFVVDVASGRIDQLTDGSHYEHSIDWSPNGQELLFLTNRDADEDEFFNYDVYAMKLSDKSIRRLTATESNEYRPRWSPDGTMVAFEATRRGLTDRETTMEDTHAWVMNANGTNRREIGVIDNRQGAPEWTDDSTAPLFTFMSNDNRFEVEAFLTKPIDMTPAGRYPLIVNIHGGPHGQQGPAFNFRNQVYAARGWATLMVNYRGSTGYGQAFADAVFADQNGNEGQDV